MTDSTSSETGQSCAATEQKPPRQRPGLACKHCRAKKLKCDGEQPSCGNCQASGVPCVTPPPSNKRGPQKGHLRALHSRLASLEQQVLSSRTQPEQAPTSVDETTIGGTHAFPTPASLSCTAPIGTSAVPSRCNSISDSTGAMVIDNVEPSIPIDDFLFNGDFGFGDPVPPMPGNGYPLFSPLLQSSNLLTPPEPIPDFSNDPLFLTKSAPTSIEGVDSSGSSKAGSSPSSPFVISDLLRTDLEQLYFDRTHRFVPILYQRRYFSWSRSPNKSEAQTCLQYAIWTSAASLSSHLQSIRESLYSTTTQLLAALEAKEEMRYCIEHVQARILIFIYDFMRSTHARGWMSAGQCFRLIQLMRLFETDRGGNTACSMDEKADWITIEEQRRAFWIAFCLDIYISIRQDSPLMLHEHIHRTRLPMPEEKFQSGEYVEMGYLTDDFSIVDHLCQAPFNESIICSALYMHSTLYKRRAQQGLHVDVEAFWSQHEKLDTAVRCRLAAYQRYGTRLIRSDPILLFTCMILHMTVLSLFDTIELLPWSDNEHQSAALGYQQRALSAATEIFNLSQSLAHISYLKMHPFTPVPLAVCAQFFTDHRYLDNVGDSRLQALETMLSEMDVVNNLALSQSSRERSKWLTGH